MELGVVRLDAQLTEQSISTLVSDASIFAKIDRPAKIVSFHRPLSPEEQLSNWSGTCAWRRGGCCALPHRVLVLVACCLLQPTSHSSSASSRRRVI